MAGLPGAWSALPSYLSTLWAIQREAHEKYWPVVRIAPDWVLFTSSQAWNDIYGFQHGEPEISKDTSLYKTSKTPHTIITADHDPHRLYRRPLSKGFSETALREQEPLDEETEKGIALETTSWYKLSHLSTFFTFNLIGELAFGESFGCLELWASLISVLIRFGPKFYEERVITNNQLTHEKVYIYGPAPNGKKSGYNDLSLDLFNPKYNLQRYQINGNCSTHIIAGSETTTAALSATPYYLMQSPEAKDNVIQEVRNRFSGVDETNAIGTDQLKYLPTCFSEAVRKFPPAPSVFSGRVSKLGANITGKLMPEAHGGTKMMIATQCKVFTIGPWNCLGQNLAKLEIRLLLFRFIPEFNWELVASSGLKPLRIRLSPVVR
ncbi:cytochrome P450 [Aspergillus alliaceus]|uniref:cytochrome P450 n=1 Tax=Petromyces alliaceus TaxID=209559 RepID=UPI0012A46DFB|nr:cytochrome P450 [Aspergillus alliaceus]KAB8234015.1 cytochrome P450 [Aspergillus alliaceus]